MNPRVDFYFLKAKKWRAELEHLRLLLLDSGLTEDLKWGVPCYTLQNNNVVLIHAFKDYCALLFFKGVLLKDKYGMLIQQTKHVQAARQIRFTGLEEIIKLAPRVKSYIRDAIKVEKSGIKVEFKETSSFEMPEEFKTKLKAFKELKIAFELLTPGRQRAYLLFFSAPKQSKTREARIEKNIQRILDGKGLDD